MYQIFLFFLVTFCFFFFSEFNSLMLTKRSKKLTLILFYSEYSLGFLKVQSVLKKVIEDLVPIGNLIGVAMLQTIKYELTCNLLPTICYNRFICIICFFRC